MEVHSILTLLRKDLGPMFPENPNMASVITLSFCTENDTSKSGWLSSEIGDFAPKPSGDISDQNCYQPRDKVSQGYGRDEDKSGKISSKRGGAGVKEQPVLHLPVLRQQSHGGVGLPGDGWGMQDNMS